MNSRIIRSVTLACFLALAMLAMLAWTFKDVSASTPPEDSALATGGLPLVSAAESGQALPLRQTAPVLIATKVGEARDSDGDGDIEPGDVLTYTIAITNVGSAVASDVTFSDTIDANTKLVGNSVKVSQGTVVKGNSSLHKRVVIDFGSVPAGANNVVTASFRVEIEMPPAGTTQVSNQGVVTCAYPLSVLTDDPTIPGNSDPTVTGISAAPELVAAKRRFGWTDRDKDKRISPGDFLGYEIVITNTGNAHAADVWFDDPVPGHTTLGTNSILIRPSGVYTIGPPGRQKLGRYVTIAPPFCYEYPQKRA